MRMFFIFSVAVAMSGCMTYNATHYGKIDPTNKTITVPIGSAGLNGQLKSVLSMAGWKMVVSRGPEITKGRSGDDVYLEKYTKSLSKYDLRTRSNQFDICLSGDAAIFYEIVILDNETGSEILALDGRGCLNNVVKSFSNELKVVSE